MADAPEATGGLKGKRVVVTRPAHQASEFISLLEAQGATAIAIPAVEIQPPSSSDALDDAIGYLGRYAWLIFTSVNGVESFFRRAGELAPEGFGEALTHLQVCAIGPATRNAAESHGLPVDLVPEEYVAESLVAAFGPVDLEGKRVLLPRAAVARDVAPEALRARGAVVDVVEAYRSGVPASSEAAIRALVEAHEAVDWITFTSSSTVKNFLAMGGGALLESARTASIGPVTSDTLRKHGLRVDVEASEYTVPGLVAAMNAA